MSRSLRLVLGGLAVALTISIAVSANLGDEASQDQYHRADSPVVGVITQVLRDFKKFSSQKQLHLPSSYVKWIESSGARVLPIMLNENEAYYQSVFNQTNGLLFPGGNNMLRTELNTPMMRAAKILYKLAVEANNRGDYYPIWGTCLGLELLSVLTANKNVLFDCHAIDVMVPTEVVARGKIFAANQTQNLISLRTDYPKIVLVALESHNLSYQYHYKCLVDDQAYKAHGLDNFYRILGYSRDSSNRKFINIIEAIEYPFYGVQFHPEKAAFELVVMKEHMNSAHSQQAIDVARYLADFFIHEAKKSKHKQTRGAMYKMIYNYSPMYTGLIDDMYEQRYLFPFKEMANVSDIEFTNEDE